MKKNTKSVSPGSVFAVKHGGECQVIDYAGANKVLVRFMDEHAHHVWVTADNLRKGNVRNPYWPTVRGVGYIGVGEHAIAHGSKHTSEYVRWSAIMKRCYDQNFHRKQPSYLGCYVSKEWHNFQSFANWLNKQPNWGKEGMEVDKDILRPGNKEYGPSTCVLVPSEINRMFGQKNKENEMPPGVVFDKSENRYIAVCHDGNGKQVKIGRFKDQESAFFAYRKAKREALLRLAIKHKDVLCDRVFSAIMSYEVPGP